MVYDSNRYQISRQEAPVAEKMPKKPVAKSMMEALRETAESLKLTDSSALVSASCSSLDLAQN
jgi:hypothetical protein